MIKARRHGATGTDRWMISWADLLTLLFASVVVLYASASRNGFPGRLKASPAGEQEAQTQPQNELTRPFERLQQALQGEIGQGRVLVSLETRGIVVSLCDQSYFTSGSDEVPAAALNTIGEVAAVIRELPNSVRLEGHTDSVPVHNARFHDNWSLSAARSGAMLSLLESRFSIPPSRLAIAAYADNKPMAANESAEGRARNRRVDIVILSQKNL